MRTVRLLDRQKRGAFEERTICGLKVEKGVPIPPHIVHPKTGLKAALCAMEIGESLVYPKMPSGTLGKIKDRKFSTRKLVDGNFRIWRIK